MKLFGNRKKSSHAKSGGGKSKASPKKAEPQDEEPTRKRTPEEIEEINRQIARYQKHKLRKRLIILGVLVLLVVAVFVFIKMTVKPPAVNTDGLATNTPSGSAMPASDDPNATQAPSEPPQSSTRREGVYTFLVIGNDDGNGNTDTMMVGALDTVNHTLDIVSIPRDTLVNVPWWLHKANTFLTYGEGMEGVVKGVRDITGFTVDSYVSVDLEAFRALVNALGGVYFDVPEDMYYVDPTQDLYINLSAGYQLLNADQAMGVVRYRGYASADIGRIEVQQQFLKAVADQCLQLKNVLIVDDLASIFKEYVETNLSLGNIAWYMTELLKLESENINFYTIPANYNDTINGVSYPTIYLDEWLALNNEVLNPYTTQITENHVNILTRNEYGEIYATSGEVLNWNFGSVYTEDDDDEEIYTEDPAVTDPPVETATPEQTEPPVTETLPPEAVETPPAETEPSGGGETGQTEPPATEIPDVPPDQQTGGETVAPPSDANAAGGDGGTDVPSDAGSSGESGSVAPESNA